MLLLFDIDGTLLLNASGEHASAVFEGLQQVYRVPRPTEKGLRAAGRTDLEIARGVALLAGVSAARFDAGIDDFRVACTEAYARLIPADLRAKVAPGVEALLVELAARDDVHLALLTGNLEAVARLKLRAAGLGGFFASGQGAFGSDAEDRAELPAIARRRAAAFAEGRSYPRDKTVVIGDTPRDIACARADGVRCIAVATGPYGADELTDADVVVASATELRATLLAD